MQTLFAEDMPKLAYCAGKARTMNGLGLPPAMIKKAFIAEGVSPELAEEMTKEAFWGLLARGVIAGGRALGGLGARAVAAGGTRAAGQGASRLLGKGMQGIGQLGRKAGMGLRRAGGSLARSPGKALGGGAMNFGKGMLFMGGKGVGGTLGKGTFGATMGSTLFGSGDAAMPRMAGGGMMSGGSGGGGAGMGYGGMMARPNPWTNPYGARF